jgi:hypothetical protein
MKHEVWSGAGHGGEPEMEYEVLSTEYGVDLRGKKGQFHFR